MTKKAVILAAGEGKTAQAFHRDHAKGHAPCCQQTIARNTYSMRSEKVGIEEIIVVVGYQKEVIMQYFKN